VEISWALKQLVEAAPPLIGLDIGE
jgi:hypothetical protein